MSTSTGGHDSSFHDNIVFHDGGDGQNCINTGSFLPGHGVAWYNNKCVLTDSKNIGSTGGCTCIPPYKSIGGGGGSPPQSVCGLDMHDNQYFGDPNLPGNMTMSCGGAILASEWLSSGSDQGSAVFELPSDDALIGWAREKLGLAPLPNRSPPSPPTPLPPQPPPTYPKTCVGRCWQEGHCCANLDSGCGQPSCYQGCAFAQVAPSIEACTAACNSAKGCSTTFKNVTVNMCGQCASVTPPTGMRSPRALRECSCMH
eukprot:SAG31_NODE_1102_length_9897_cov_16.273015_4_plen_257_part_00